MQALIITVGTEILLGNILDTNSKYLATRLKDLGIDLYKIISVGDNLPRLSTVLKEADGVYDYVFMTGGLGPTEDDISKEVLMDLIGEKDLILDKDAYDNLKTYFKNDKRALEINKGQAVFPKSAIVLQNEKGTAPGAIMRSLKNTSFVLMPGPPSEMIPMFEKKVLTYLPKKAVIKNLIVRTALLAEWDMAERVDLSSSNPTISPYVTDHGPILRISAKAADEKKADDLINQALVKVKSSLGKYIISSDGRSRYELIIDMLRQRGEYVACGESITGGLIASSLIDISGASDVLKESLVTYSNEAKEKYLNVSHETIRNFGVVSKEVGKEMLDGLRNLTGADLCLATTGYAHQGRVFLAVLYKDKYLIKELNIKGDRNRVRRISKNHILDLAILLMRGDYESNIDF
ncbi:MAG: CinA family nicotinamide mononucleotide deamidase-related protein [Anaerococcus sp.]|nr:CinA family nicotinamide mononucleotide deamidase-related protein [Anaerococcus sp.]